MAGFMSSSYNPTIMSSGADDSFEDVCSICLEHFNTQDPPTVTCCKHEYHLQCILEWSQRSKECPICWQRLALKDPASQELLASIENERSLSSRIKVHHISEDNEINNEYPYMDDSDFDERIMFNFSAAASRIHYLNRRGRQRSSGVGPSHVLPSSPEELHFSGHESSEVDSAIPSTTFATIDQNPAYVVPSVVNGISNTAGTSDGPVKPRVPFCQLPPDSPQSSSSSELLTLPESIKSKFSAVSARYKESISKSARGFKEKLLARNGSVKELRKGVHREMRSSIAGVARMIERLDLVSKRNEDSATLSDNNIATLNSPNKGKGTVPSNHENTGETAHDMSSHPPRYVSKEISLFQGGH